MHSWVGEHDEEGVYVYQAYSRAIADWALEHQHFGGPLWKPARMVRGGKAPLRRRQAR